MKKYYKHLFVSISICMLPVASVYADECGSARYGYDITQPTENLCNSGALTWVDTIASDGSWNWSCGVENCSSYNAICGSSHEQTFDMSTQIINLCESPNLHPNFEDGLAADGVWNWECYENPCFAYKSDPFDKLDKYDSTITIDKNDFTELSDGSRYGNNIESLGDLDGDGISDLIITTSNRIVSSGNDRVTAFVHFMNIDGSIKNSKTLMDGWNGFAIANMGDVDGDGIVDIVTTSNYSNGTAESCNMYVQFLAADGTIKSSSTVADACTGPRNAIHSVTNIGDLDNNGVNDIFYIESQMYFSYTRYGVIFLDTDGQKIAHEKGYTHENVGPIGINAATSISDLDGDGINEVVISSESEKKVYIYYMNADGTRKSYTTIIEDIKDDEYGKFVANIGDLDDDGRDEIAISADGTVFVHYMRSDGMIVKTEKIDGTVMDGNPIDADTAKSYKYGSAVANIGDLDGNGEDDIAVGANEANSDNSGAVYVHLRGIVLPKLAQKTVVDSSLNYVFTSTEPGTITYSGKCTATKTVAIVGDNKIIFQIGVAGTVDDCGITVTDQDGNISKILKVSAFTVDDDRVNSGEESEKKSIISKIKDVILEISHKDYDLDDDHVMYVRKDEFTFEGKNKEIKNGKVKLYVDNHYHDEEDIKSDGKWKIEYDCDDDCDDTSKKEYEIVIYDEDDNKIDTKKYEIRIDKKDPSIDIPSHLSKRSGSVLWWTAYDNYKLKKTYFYWDGKKHKMKITGAQKKEKRRQEFVIPYGTSKGIHDVKIKTYDKAGNKVYKYMTVRVY